MLAIVISLCVAAVAVAGFIVALFQFRENHSDRAGSKLSTMVKTLIQQETKPMDERLQEHTTRLTQAGDRLNRIEELLRDIANDNRAFADNVAKMGVKVDMYWTSLEALAMNSAKNLHQPDPRREHIDKLLEAFMEGTLTAEERIELRKTLVTIRNYEPNGTTVLDFPVHPGEQTAAAILLSTMDLVDPVRMAVLGHSAHRSHAAFPVPGDADNE